MNLATFTSNYKLWEKVHPWHKPFSPQCISKNCKNKPLEHKGIHYSCCRECLERNDLGPFRKRIHKKNDYSTLFWTTDIQRKHK